MSAAPPGADIAERWARVVARVDAACARAGRGASAAEAGVRVVAVSKRHPAEAVAAAFRAGVRVFGESYAQELAAKRPQVAQLLAEAHGDAALPAWHFVGALQRNKAGLVVGAADLVHAVDSPRLARAIEARAAAAGLVQDVLVEVNAAGEATKSGVAPAAAGALVAEIADLPHVACRGLMCMPPLPDDPEDSRPHFRALRQLRDRLATPAWPLPELSMGTTGDFEIAVEEGATLVRVGTAIFGPRPG